MNPRSLIKRQLGVSLPSSLKYVRAPTYWQDAYNELYHHRILTQHTLTNVIGIALRYDQIYYNVSTILPHSDDYCKVIHFQRVMTKRNSQRQYPPMITSRFFMGTLVMHDVNVIVRELLQLVCPFDESDTYQIQIQSERSYTPTNWWHYVNLDNGRLYEDFIKQTNYASDETFIIMLIAQKDNNKCSCELNSCGKTHKKYNVFTPSLCHSPLFD